MATEVSIFHTVHVVSIEEVTMRDGDFSFQEKFVKGAPVDWLWTLDCYHALNESGFSINDLDIHQTELSSESACGT